MKSGLPTWITIDLAPDLQPVGRYMWSLFADSQNIDYESIDHNGFELIIDRKGLFAISDSFDLLLNGKIASVCQQYNLPEGLDDFARTEPLACCFYLINSLHEHLLPPSQRDRFDRYPFKASIQYKADIIHVNYCQKIFNQIYSKVFGKSHRTRTSEVFWSHDIDFLYSDWKVDLLLGWRLKKIKLLWQGLLKTLDKKSKWDNIEDILAIEKTHGLISTFFFLTEEGKFQSDRIDKISHADYSISHAGIQKKIDQILDSGSQIGLHKSSFPYDYQTEIAKIRRPITSNRNHFLQFHLPHHYENIQKSGLSMDSSLGFAEQYGFRNSYGRPFHPFDLKRNKPYSFIEVPLHLMDASFTDYLDFSEKEMQNKIISFLHDHREDCVISILLHNTRMDLKTEDSLAQWKEFYRQIQSLNLAVFK
ncbi:DUF7033 domain-containing protein [Membranihabitans marinus]|uniref:DUF7033 domain-containing protein n=1 Tax=Membranihabitans marinus TaxID=1227546 RepID=UPI001F39FC98|nr:hypothetical protein [Membranihabitans marinus]